MSVTALFSLEKLYSDGSITELMLHAPISVLLMRELMLKARVSILGTVKQCHADERLDTIQKIELFAQKQNGN